jgi:hypothetical protein
MLEDYGYGRINLDISEGSKHSDVPLDDWDGGRGDGPQRRARTALGEAPVQRKRLFVHLQLESAIGGIEVAGGDQLGHHRFVFRVQVSPGQEVQPPPCHRQL